MRVHILPALRLPACCLICWQKDYEPGRTGIVLASSLALALEPLTVPVSCRIKRIARFAVAVALMLCLILSVSTADLVSTLTQAAPVGIIGALLLTLAHQLVVAERIQRLTAGLGLQLPFWTLFRINLSAVFYGLLLPAGNMSGVAARLYQMAQEGDSYAEPAVALMAERLLATVTLCALGALFWLVEHPTGSWPVFVLMLTGAAGFSALYLAVFTPLPLAAPLWRALFTYWPRKLEALREVLERFHSLPFRFLVSVFVLGIAGHLISIAAYCLLASSAGLDLRVVTVAWTRSAALMIALLPVTVAGFGLREGALVVLLLPYGVDSAHGVAYGLLAFAATVLSIGLLGGVLEVRRWLAQSA